MSHLNRRRSAGFSLIELLIALGIMGVAFVPMLSMFTTALEQTDFTDDLTTARQLAQQGMEWVRNGAVTKHQLHAKGSFWKPSLEQAPLSLNNKLWRVYTHLVPDSNPVQIIVSVHRVAAGSQDPVSKPIVEVASLYEDLDWAVYD